MATEAPAAPRALATHAPMPLAAPVTRAICPFKLSVFIVLPPRWCVRSRRWTRRAHFRIRGACPHAPRGACGHAPRIRKCARRVQRRDRTHHRGGSTMNTESLKGQIALVTGAASGIGAGVARALGAAGASVAINYVTNPEAAEAVAAEVQGLGGKAMTLEADVSNEDDVREMFRALFAAWGTIDILVNNAGLQKDAAFTDMTLAQWNTVIGVNLTGMFLCARESAREMVDRGIRAD